MAYLRRRSKNTWQATISLGIDPTTGKQKRVFRTIHAQNERQAQQKADELEQQMRGGISVERLRVADLLDRWLQHVKTLRAGTRTYDSYARCSVRIRDALGHLWLDQLRPGHVQDWIEGLLSDGARKDGRQGGLSPQTVRQHHSALRAALSYAVARGWIVRNPAIGIDLPEVQTRRKELLTRDQVDALLRAAEGTRWHIVFWLAAHTGMRVGEIGGLWWDDIDWDEPALRLQRALKRTSDDRHFIGPLKNHEARTIYLRQVDVEVLRAHRSRQEIERAMNPRWLHPEHVVTQPGGKWLYMPSTRKALHRFCRAAGVPPISIHDLRHIHGSHLLQYDGWDLAAVSERLGHHSVAFTARVYIHVIGSAQKRYIQAAENRDRDRRMWR